MYLTRRFIVNEITEIEMYSPDSDTNREKCVSNNNEEHEEIVVPSNMKCNQSIKVGIEK